jgi:hypothetical protein
MASEIPDLVSKGIIKHDTGGPVKVLKTMAAVQ